ncbi:hypothetical protein ACFV4P_35250 [Kitasatospora sp. NPDC059795]|uniref:hypothetical protein n=1 Tax=unclassified Kitasatospora TaxID=2633591 RepID=UPI00094066C4|nr:hypothetical protein [Kitasatospora sp. CB01950]OKJ07369.1 hypothetical protein AMK19_20645 [Kitasatospora sp. CB01950]
MKGPQTGYAASIEGITETTSFASLADALASLWGTLRTLPLGWTQYEAYRYFFGPDAAQRTEGFLARDGHLLLSFVLLGHNRQIRVVPTSDGPLQPAPKRLELLNTPAVMALCLHDTVGFPDPEERLPRSA